MELAQIAINSVSLLTGKVEAAKGASAEVRESLNSLDKAATSTQRVLEALVELHHLGQRATRYTVQELTGLPLAKVDDRIKILVEREEIKRFLKGEYVPVEVHPSARPISKMLLGED